MDFPGRKILVVGLGKTGIGLCRFLASQGADVTAMDSATPPSLTAALEALRDCPVRFDLGSPQPSHWREYDMIIPSPGVPPESAWLQEAAAAGIPVIGELEVASAFLRLPVAAVSGTNGKTTTTTLVGEMLRASGKRPLVGGNIGTPLVDLLPAQVQADCWVLEISSFQLDTATSFRPQAAALLNISDDHLDRYPDGHAYARSKARLFQRQQPEDLAVLNADDPQVAALASGLRSRIYLYSGRRTLTTGAWRTDGAITVRLAGGVALEFPLAEILLPEAHNRENIMAALLLALEMGATPTGCREVLASFRGLPHRLEWVAQWRGVDFFDDSKATNVGAVIRSLEHFNRPVVLIAGGRDKGGDYSPLKALVRRKVKTLILLGEARPALAAAFKGLTAMHPATDLNQAVELAAAAAAPGDVVLLSPACSSFDMFRDYAERGNVFQQAVRSLAYGRQNSRLSLA
ncbi:MAG: UDP-N-acetylmuramoyl-L-alanine--D-glutamate ligase [Deltaproteobacteria bacterium]|nr:UDP-N-acetylmuramoyl-L-alanine--D-glutamate ligase [Deltaproteobacteria bacterium]